MNLFSRLVRIAEAWISDSASPSDTSRRSQRTAETYTESTAEHTDRVDPKIAGYFANLEIPYDSDLATVKAAWKKMMRKYHPDLHAGDVEKRRTAEMLTQQLNTAYEELDKYLRNSNR